jgi:hypothetical protein
MRSVRPPIVELVGDVVVSIEFKVRVERFERGTLIQPSNYACNLGPVNEAIY